MRLAAIVLLLRVMAQWMACYPTGDSDDKAVHYYSAVHLFAGPAAARAVERATPGWLAQLDADDRRHGPERTLNRLRSSWNYVLPSSLLRGVIEIMRPPGEPPRSFLLPVAITFTLVALASLAWLAWVAWRTSACLLFAALCLGSCLVRFVPAWLAPWPAYDYFILVYVSRGPALLLLLAALVAAHQRRWRVALVSLLLVFTWHVGLALLTIGPAVLAVALGGLVPSSTRSRVLATGSAAVVALVAGVVPVLPDGLWIPAASLGVLFHMAGRVDESPRRAAAMAAGFLVGVGLLVATLGAPDLVGTLLHHTTPVVARQLTSRLSGARYLAAAALVLALAILAAHAAWRLARRPLGRHRAIACAGLVLALFMLTQEKRALLTVVTRRAGFFMPERVQVARLTVTSGSLHELDPRIEDSFFASLGDFLLRATPSRGE